jgi:ribonuclease HI
LFLIYIRNLFQSRGVTFISYLDDIALVASSKSFKKNITILEREAKELIQIGGNNAISFDIIKTELIHFQKNSKAESPTLYLPSHVVTPKPLIKWLGIYFDENLVYKEHIAIKALKASHAFYRMNRLVNISRGLSPFAVRQLYLACVTSIADYGAVLWFNSKSSDAKLAPLQLLQNAAIRRVLGVFKTAPIRPIEVESALVPTKIRLSHMIRRYSLRMLQLNENYPVNVKLQQIRDSESLYYYTSDTSAMGRRIKRNKKQLQLKYLSNSIKLELFSDTKTDTIVNNYYSPWDKVIYYLVEICTESKEEAAKQHISYLKSLYRQPFVSSIYTDASKLNESNNVGISLVMYNHNTAYIPEVATYSENRNLGSHVIVYNSELEAVTSAIEYAASVAKRGEYFNVFSDNQAILKRLSTLSDKPGQSHQIRANLAAKSIIDKGAKIVLKWVPGHEAIIGNKEADKLAKLATALDPPDNTSLSFTYINLLISAQKFKKWSNLLIKYSEKHLRDKGYIDSYSKVYP